MRRRFGQALRIGVSGRALALLRTSAWRGEPLTVLAEHRLPESGGALPAIDAIGLGLRELLANAGCARWPATLVLDDQLVRLWQVTPPAASTRMGDLEAAAKMRFQNLYGEPPGAWQVSAGWDPCHPFLAAAMPRQLLAHIAQAAREQQVAVVEIVPQFVAGWNRWCGAMPADAWFALVHDGVLSLGAIEHGAVSSVRAVPLPARGDPDWLTAHTAREALRLNLPAPAHLLVCGQAPLAWHGGNGRLGCTVLPAGQGQDWSAAVHLGATGSRA